MKSTQTTYIFLAFIAILMWNGFLIQRDKKMFESYEQQGRPQVIHKCNPNCNVK